MKKPVIISIVLILILLTVAMGTIALIATNNNAIAKNATANFTIINADYYPPTQNEKAVIEISSTQSFVAYAKENNITTIYQGNVFRSYIFHSVYWFVLNATIICTEWK